MTIVTYGQHVKQIFFFFKHIDVNNQCVVMVMKTFVQNGPTIKEDVVVIIIITCNIYDA